MKYFKDWLNIKVIKFALYFLLTNAIYAITVGSYKI